MRREAELVGDELRDRAAGSNPRARPRRAATRRRASRQSCQRSKSRAERPEVREQVVREQHRLRALQVRVTGQVRRRSPLRPGAAARVCSSWMRVACTRPSRRRKSRRSSATWSLRLRPVCSFAPVAPGDLGDAALDRGVDVFVGRREREGARRPAPLRRAPSAAAMTCALLARRADRRVRACARARAIPRDRRPRGAGRTGG